MHSNLICYPHEIKSLLLLLLSRCVSGTYFSFCGLLLDIAMNCGILLYRSLKSKGIYIYDGLSDNFNKRYECRYSLDCITNFQTIMNITNSLTIALTPVRLHSVYSVRIPFCS